MQELQIPTRAIPVDIVMSHGERLRGRLFLAESPYHEGNPEDLQAALNDERRFLPFTQEDALGQDAKRFLVNKYNMVRVHLLESDQRWHNQPGDLAACKITLGDGSAMCGQLDVDTPKEASRLVDKLNNAPEFVTVVTEEGTVYVHHDNIVRVESLAPLGPDPSAQN